MGFKPTPMPEKHLSAISNRATKLHRGTRSYVQLGLFCIGVIHGWFW